MKTVPTLAASATLLGASAVGLGFGRETEPPYPSKKRKATPAQNELDRRSIQAAVQTNFRATAFPTAPPPGAPFARPLSARITTTTRPNHEPRPVVRRRMTSADPASLPLNGPVGSAYTPSGDLITNDQNTASRPPSRRASWVKRLSTISNSQPSSRDTSPGPISPSVSCSNGSMAFSHDGSTAPMLPGERPSAPLPPNKLVKRSSSINGSREQPGSYTASRRPSFRRPATSHQRSATLQYQTALLEMTKENPSSERQPLQPSADSEVEYAHYFTATVTTEKTLSKGKGPLSTNTTAFKRIMPGDKMHRPTLMFARSISAGAASQVVEEAESEDDNHSLYFTSRPGTATESDSHHTVDSQNAVPSEDLVQILSDSRARSFSINNLLSPGTNGKKLRAAELPGAKLVRRISQRRTSSEPLSTMEKRLSTTAHGDSGAVSGRRPLLNEAALAQREIAASSGPTHSRAPQHGALVMPSLSSPLPELPYRAAVQTELAPAPMRVSDVQPSAVAPANQPPPSPTVAQTGVRPSRNSMAPSEQASTLVGSDNDARGAGTGDEDDADVQSETVFDSLRTGGARSTSGARGPRIETIFDESPPSKIKVTALRDLLPTGTFREQSLDTAPGQQIITEEEESISTPVRTVVPDRSIHESPTYSRGTPTPRFPNILPSSPPDMPKPLNLGTLEWDSRVEDDGSSSAWSVDDDDQDSWGDLPARLPTSLTATHVSLGRPLPRLFTPRSSPKAATPHHVHLETGDRDARSSIFDWSEQQPADKGSGNRTPPRPSTVHGKKDADRRGSRIAGRRATSGLHARSQSVPAVPDATGKRSTVVTNKFGTWGVGSKGVTEDWNDDFDFEDVGKEATAPGTVQSQRVDSGMAMVVPDHIQEQQNNVLANIGLLREWGLLIEELKEQRVRAACLGVLDGSYAAMWEEVDAMIDLADQEAEHDGVPRLSPPSSPGFDEVAFDDVARSSPIPNGAEKRRSGLASEALGKQNMTLQSNYPKRKTILPPNQQIFGPQPSSQASRSNPESSFTVADVGHPTGRPRKDSEAKARSIIEALQKRRSIHEPLPETQPPSPSKKVPFDTATLRRIVPHVSGLNRKVKQTLREAEGLYSSPSTSPNHEAEPPFSKMFPADGELSAQMKLMTVM